MRSRYIVFIIVCSVLLTACGNTANTTDINQSNENETSNETQIKDYELDDAKPLSGKDEILDTDHKEAIKNPTETQVAAEENPSMETTETQVTAEEDPSMETTETQVAAEENPSIETTEIQVMAEENPAIETTETNEPQTQPIETQPPTTIQTTESIIWLPAEPARPTQTYTMKYITNSFYNDITGETYSSSKTMTFDDGTTISVPDNFPINGYTGLSYTNLGWTAINNNSKDGHIYCWCYYAVADEFYAYIDGDWY